MAKISREKLSSAGTNVIIHYATDPLAARTSRPQLSAKRIGLCRVSGKEKGAILAGKLADLVILSRDIFKIDPREIEKVNVVMTIMGGRVVYEARP